jgi:hypothetical protein
MHVPDHLVADLIEVAAIVSATGVITPCAGDAAPPSPAGSINEERRAALTS